MKFSFPMPGGGTGLTLFSKLVRTKDLRSVQGENPRSKKPKLTVSAQTNNNHTRAITGWTLNSSMLNIHMVNNEIIFCLFFFLPLIEMLNNIGLNVARRWFMLWYRYVSSGWYGS